MFLLHTFNVCPNFIRTDDCQSYWEALDYRMDNHNQAHNWVDNWADNWAADVNEEKLHKLCLFKGKKKI